MAFSLDTLEDIRKSLIDTIAMVERENAMLTAKIDRLLPGLVSDILFSSIISVVSFCSLNWLHLVCFCCIFCKTLTHHTVTWPITKYL